MPRTAIRLGRIQDGEAAVRVVAVDRSSPRRTLVDLDVSSSLRGGSTAAHAAGDDAHVPATDTQENGLVEGIVLRDDVPPAEVPWPGMPGLG